MKKEDKVAIIQSLEKTFNLYKPPDRIGEIIEYEDDNYLVIGIERVRFAGKKLKVLYTCQNLDIVHESQSNMVNPFDDFIELYVDIDTLKSIESFDHNFIQDRQNLLPIGQIFHYKEHYYRWVTYTDLEFEFTTLRISGLAQPVYPMTMKKARKMLISHKKKKLNLALIR